MKKTLFFNLLLYPGLLIMILLLIAYYKKPKITFNNQADGFAYYLPLRSYLFDHNFDFTNENLAFENSYKVIPYYWMTKTKNNYPVYQYAIGTSILWTPLLLISSIFTNRNTNINISPVSLSELKGYSDQYLNLLTIETYCYGILTVILTFLILLKFDNKHRWLAFLSVIITSLSTPFFYYYRYQPLMSHINSAFAVSIFIFVFVFFDKKNYFRFLVLGLILGLVFLVRWQDSVVGILIIPELIELFISIIKRKKTNISLIQLGTFLLSLINIIIIQMMFWKELYGSPIIIPQGRSFFSDHLYVIKFLFSYKHGLITWSPSILLAIFGFIIFFCKQNTSVKKFNKWNRFISICIIIFFLFVYINSSINDWHGSYSFGARRMTSFFPIWSLGIYILLISIKKFKRTALLFICFVLVIYNIFFADLYFLHKIEILSEVKPKTVINLIKNNYMRK